ncbi:hypothetical protein [Fictibacillus enclensis]|uniref:hypothetical protein n=1 Tax=Fictibacillus enclensis TaxID=1017270 RepID=UPI0011465CAF|nr:hypothetical protein [Fictibacillus enclensis]
MKQLNEKAKNRTISKEEWKQLRWNKRFKRRRENGEIIYPVTFREHLYRWHGGSYKKSLPGKPLNDSVNNDF